MKIEHTVNLVGPTQLQSSGAFRKCLMVMSAILLSSLTLCPVKAEAQTSLSNRPIVFIHGFNVFGLPEDCKSDWGKMEDSLRAQGFTGPLVTAGYYGIDKNCDVITSPHGSIVSKTVDLTRDLAWYFYNTYNKNGTSVDVVAHSFGGLLARYALYRVSIGDPSFPPFLNVSHVTTLASPFEGYSLLAEACHIVVWNQECYDMFPLSSFIKELNSAPAMYPQGINGTTWSNAGSNADVFDDSDGLVNSSSATSMDVTASRKLIMPWYKFVFHTMYNHNDDVIAWVNSTLSDRVSANAARVVQAALPNVVEPANIIVLQSRLVEDVTRMPASQRPAHIAPFYVNGVQQGVQFTKVLPGGMFAEMGIQENDVVQGCTAATLNTPSFPIEGLKQKGNGKFKLCLIRGGAKQTLVVSAQ